jgi:type I restriction-modification system DNA methylase subunit
MAKTNSSRKSSSNGNGANLGFEAKLWLAADKLRNNMDAAEYKHVVLGLIFLKYISDSFEEMHQRLLAAKDEGADPEDADEYRAENVFWVPKEARWSHLQGKAKQPTIGKEEIEQHGYVLTPGRYVGAEEVEDDGEPFEEKMNKLVSTLNEQFAESRKIEKAIRQNLAGLGFSEDRT